MGSPPSDQKEGKLLVRRPIVPNFVKGESQETYDGLNQEKGLDEALRDTSDSKVGKVRRNAPSKFS